MKISIVSINYAPEPTGIAVYTTGMAEYLAQCGMQVTAHTAFPYYPAWSKSPADRNKWHRREDLNGVSVRRNYLYVPKRPTTLKRILHELSFVASVTLSYLFAPRADLTIIVAPPLLAGIPVSLLARLKGSRIVFHVQDLQPDAAINLGMLKRGALTRLLYFLEWLTYRLADRVSTISEGMRNNIIAKEIEPDKLFLFRNWANDDVVTPRPSDTSYRREWNLGQKFVVLYSGNMGIKQGLGILLEAASRLQHHRDIIFIIVGDGGEKNELIKRAQNIGLNNVLFKPVQPYEKLGELLATADVTVIPQKKGAHDIVLPSKLANILSSQRALVAAAAAHSEFGKIVLRAQCGLLVEPENSAQLADALFSLFIRPLERLEFAHNGRRYMEQHLGYRTILGQFRERLLTLGERG